MCKISENCDTRIQFATNRAASTAWYSNLLHSESANVSMPVHATTPGPADRQADAPAPAGLWYCPGPGVSNTFCPTGNRLAGENRVVGAGALLPPMLGL